MHRQLAVPAGRDARHRATRCDYASSGHTYAKVRYRSHANGPGEQKEENSCPAKQTGDNRQQGDAPDFVGDQARANGRSARHTTSARIDAHSNQKSISRQNQTAELEEVRVHVREQTKPTHWAVQQCAGEPVLRRWDSPQLFRHSGLADTAHGADCSSRVPVR